MMASPQEQREYTAMLGHRSSGVGGQQNSMLRVGQDLTTMNQQKLITKRHKRGECLSCGTKIFKVGVFGKRTPLTVRGAVLNGRCLSCFPLERDAAVVARARDVAQTENANVVADVPAAPAVRVAGTTAPVVRATVPEVLQLQEQVSDDMTMISAITLDHRLVSAGDHGCPIDDDYTINAPDFAGSLRPEHSQLCDADDEERPVLPLRNRATVNEQPQRIASVNWVPPPVESFFLEEQEDEHSSAEAKNEIELDVAIPELSRAHGEGDSGENTQANGPVDVFFGRGFRINNGDSEEHQLTDEPRDPSGVYFKQNSDLEEATKDEERRSGRTSFISLSSKPVSPELSENAAQDIRSHVEKLHTDCGDETNLNAMKVLAGIIWRQGIRAKMMFVECKGIEALTTIIWADIDDNVIQEAALELLLALVSSQDGEAASDIIVGSESEACVDALLIAMHTMLSDERVQELGCTILCCLASATLTNANVCDGSLSGAVVAVLNAMEAHRGSLLIQECGIRALFEQCIFSRNASANKRALVESKVESGRMGSEILCGAMVNTEAGILYTERLCQLYWGISVDDTNAKKFSSTPIPFAELVSTIMRCKDKPEAASLVQACFGAIANFTKIESNLASLDADAVVEAALCVLERRRDFMCACTEACCAVSSVAAALKQIEKHVRGGALETMFTAAFSSSGNCDFRGACFRAFVALADRSDSAKDSLLQPPFFSMLARVRSEWEESMDLQLIYCRLIASACQKTKKIDKTLVRGILRSIERAMSAHADSEGVQEAGCLAVAVLSGRPECKIPIETVGRVVSAMECYHSCASVQLNGCRVLWDVSSSMGAKSSIDFTASCISSLVKAIQTHLENKEILVVACGALENYISGSDKMKSILAGIDGGIDAVTCVLVMHPDSTDILERAIGILTSLSSRPAVSKHVVSAEWIDSILDVMQNNNESPALLASVSIFLRNVILADPRFVENANGAISIVINAMRHHKKSAEFQRAACNLLWIMSATSAESRAKILELDGVSVLMDTLEGSQVQGVQDAALGAFNEIALTSVPSS